MDYDITLKPKELKIDLGVAFDGDGDRAIFISPLGQEVNGDEILFILDDVSISRLDIPTLVDIRNKHNIDIISPAIFGATWSYMLPNGFDVLAITNHLEVYCMIMTPNNFQKYLSINTFENKWIWGVDHLFGHFGINTAIYYGMNACHIIPAAHGCSEEAHLLMKEYDIPP